MKKILLALLLLVLTTVNAYTIPPMPGGSVTGATINDSAGNGDTTETWSADKIYDQLALKLATDGKATDLNLTGQTTGDIPYFNGTKWVVTKKISLANDAAQFYDTATGAYSNSDCTATGVPAACCTGSGTGTCAPKKILIDSSGITADKTITIKEIATDNITITRTYTGTTNLTYPTSGTLQTVKTEKLAVFNIPGDSADNTVVDAYVPVAATITGVLITTTGAACSAVVDIWADTYANFPATVVDTITASAKPTLSTAQKNKDTTLTGWTTAISADTILRANLDSSDCTGLIQVTIFGTK